MIKWVSEWVTLITSRASCDANNIFQRSDYVPSFAWANFIVGQAWSNSDTRQKRDALQSSNYVSNLILEMIKLWRNWLLFSGQQKTNQNSFQGLLDRLIKQNRRLLPRMNFCLSANWSAPLNILVRWGILPQKLNKEKECWEGTYHGKISKFSWEVLCKTGMVPPWN